MADTGWSYRVLETSHQPVYDIPQSDVKMTSLKPNAARNYCEYKGRARY